MSNKPSVYQDDSGTIVFRGSALGHCIIELVASLLGETATPPFEGLRAAFDASGGLEQEILDRVAEEIGPVMGVQDEMDLYCRGPADEPERVVVIRSHRDGVLCDFPELLEVKAFGPDLFHGYLVDGMAGLGDLALGYSWQKAVYGHTWGLPVRFVVGEKLQNDAGEFYVGRVLIGEPEDPERIVPMRLIEERVEAVLDYASRDEMPECDRKCRKGGWWDHVHQWAAPIKGDEQLAELLERDTELESVIKSAQAERDSLRDGIKEQFAAGEYTVGPFTMHLIRKAPKKFNSRQHKKENPQCHEAYTFESDAYLEMRVQDSRKEKK